jgi:hypothetical protein
MLYLEHPQTPHVFAASRQEDLILDYCKRISLSGADGRRFMLEVVRPAFAALRWLATNRFAGEPHIPDAIDELERQVEQLAGLPLRDPDHASGPADQCPACGSKPTTPSKYDPTPYCSRCLDVIMPALMRVRSCEAGFGTAAI